MPQEERKIKIYIISEDSYIQDYAVLMLVGENYDVKFYNKQSDALAVLEKDSPDLIISDVVMPEMNGIEFSSKVKNDIRQKTILSASFHWHCKKSIWLEYRQHLLEDS